MKKGFTLTELLAIIVILAVISLITVFSVLKVVDKVKIEAAKSSVYGYLESVSQNLSISYLKNDPTLKFPDDNDLTSGNDDDDLILEKILVKGTKPDFVTLQFDKKNIISGGFCINGYNFIYDGKETKNTDIDYCKFATVKSVTIENIESNIDITKTLQLNTVLDPSDVIPVYSSSNESLATVSSSGLVTALNIGEVVITARAGIKKATITLNIKENESLLGKIVFHNYENDTIHNLVANGETYSSHIYNYEGDQTWTSNMTFGNSSDVGSASTNAVNTVVVKVNGNLTINSGVTVGSYNSTYGGPKGFILYVSGTLTNNGLISGSTRGAKGPGQNVYLWKNENGTYEYIPAIGANGAARTYGYSTISYKYHGSAGSAGTLRKTGGGGSGAVIANDKQTYSGAGSTGTSYAGGSGGGGSYNGATAESGIAGSKGGNGNGVALYTWSCGGGAGIPGGIGANGGSQGTNGTGGLVIIAAKNVINQGTFVSNGSPGGNGYRSGAGGSGAGSINIFYKTSITNGSLVAVGGSGGLGTRSSESANGGAGGVGSITIKAIPEIFLD